MCKGGLKLLGIYFATSWVNCDNAVLQLSVCLFCYRVSVLVCGVLNVQGYANVFKVITLKYLINDPCRLIFFGPQVPQVALIPCMSLINFEP